ncbi:MAG: hypothetical protein R3190_05985 [Thermoanaerobaculia bacterium]|nr:hypothetical protein [Thermoanaerobaculia bacterium]
MTRPASRGIGLAAPLLWMLGLLGLAYALFRLHDFYQDDAFISLTYARNLLAGDGLTWSGEKIEGYSNFLFVLLTAGLGGLGIDLVAAGRIVGAAFGIATVAAGLSLWGAARKDSGTSLGAASERALTGLYAFLLLTSVPLVAWSLGGLETTLFAFLVTMGVRSTLAAVGTGGGGPAVAGGAWFGLAVLARPDGGVFWLAALSFLAARAATGRARALPALACAAGALAVLVPYAAWKLWYFGDLVPNTWYAKSAGIPLAYKLRQGLAYLSSFIATPPALALFAAAALVVRPLGAVRGSAVHLATWTSLVFFAYQLAVGGDFMAYFRFFAPLVPLLALIVVGVARELLACGREALALALAGSIAVLGAAALVPLATAPGSASALVVEVAAPHIESEWSPGALVAINASGALPYYRPDYRYVDMLGLNDRHIARRSVTQPRGRVGHLKGDGDYVLGRAPDYLLLGFPYGAEEVEPVFLGDREILADPRLATDYRKVTVALPVPRHLERRLAAVADAYPSLRYAPGTLRFSYYERAATATDER